MADLATAADIVVELGRDLTDTEQTQIVRQLQFASARLRAAVPQLDERLANGTLDAVLVAGTIAAAIVRAMRASSARADIVAQQTSGATSVTYRSNASTSLSFTADELRTLRPKATQPRVRSARLGWPGWC